jgi:hypothetical protein
MGGLLAVLTSLGGLLAVLTSLGGLLAVLTSLKMFISFTRIIFYFCFIKFN